MQRDIVIIAHNIRSCFNIGSLLRTADGLGASRVFLTGYTPYPITENDKRLPHIRNKIDQQIHKTALGAEQTVQWQQSDSITEVITDLKTDGYTVAALEQTPTSIVLPEYVPPQKIAIILGEEVAGVQNDILSLATVYLEIPMFGAKESFNVTLAAAMTLYHLRFAPM